MIAIVCYSTAVKSALSDNDNWPVFSWNSVMICIFARMSISTALLQICETDSPGTCLLIPRLTAAFIEL